MKYEKKKKTKKYMWKHSANKNYHMELFKPIKNNLYTEILKV